MTEQRIFVIDSQGLNAAQLCPERYNLSLVQYKQRASKETYLDEGAIMHHMFQCYYTLIKYRDRWSRNNFDLSKAVEVALKVGEYFTTKATSEVDWEELSRVFKEYTTFYKDDYPDIVAVEAAVAKVLYEDEDLKIIYQGKIDLVEYHPQLSRLPWDHKTMRKRSSGAPDLSNQFKGYCWLLGVNDLRVNRVGFQTSLKPNEKFSRPIISYPNEIVEEWVKDTTYWAKMMIFYQDSGYYPHNLTSCDKYNGCPYKEICISIPAARRYKLDRDFVDVPIWDVGGVL